MLVLHLYMSKFLEKLQSLLFKEIQPHVKANARPHELCPPIKNLMRMNTKSFILTVNHCQGWQLLVVYVEIPSQVVDTIIQRLQSGTEPLFTHRVQLSLNVQ